jgi:hypothetical protein
MTGEDDNNRTEQTWPYFMGDEYDDRGESRAQEDKVSQGRTGGSDKDKVVQARTKCSR